LHAAASADKQQVNGCEHSFGHPQLRPCGEHEQLSVS
jgi:hypothetical protein